jgi:hypothetical protein
LHHGGLICTEKSIVAVVRAAREAVVPFILVRESLHRHPSAYRVLLCSPRRCHDDRVQGFVRSVLGRVPQKWRVVCLRHTLSVRILCVQACIHTSCMCTFLHRHHTYKYSYKNAYNSRSHKQTRQKDRKAGRQAGRQTYWLQLVAAQLKKRR